MLLVMIAGDGKYPKGVEKGFKNSP